MAGAGLLIIKRRIKSVTSTKKITKAMGLVATSKLRKCRQRLEVNKKYSTSFNETMEDILKSHEGVNIYRDGNESKKILYIVLTSDSGLCGGFNATVLSSALELVAKDKDNSSLMIVGQKGRSFFKKLNIPVVAEYVDIPDLPRVKEGRTIAEHVLSLYAKSEVGEVYILYTKFVSVLKQTVITEKLLPLGASEDDNYESYIKFEPNINEIFNSILPLYISERILNYMINSKASEQGSRMSAMDGATKNANDLLDDLNLKYNRVRQGVITQEISEIVGGAEAQK
jgi:F-type H+-transporting ATPase subunit gamma